MDSSEIRGLLTKKRDLLKEILGVTNEQPGLIDAETMDGLLDNIAKRQQLIDAVELIDRQLDSMAPAQVLDGAEAVALTAEMHACLEEIMKQDEKNEAQATLRMKELREQLKNLQEGHRRTNAYMNEGEMPAIFFDKQK